MAADEEIADTGTDGCRRRRASAVVAVAGRGQVAGFTQAFRWRTAPSVREGAGARRAQTGDRRDAGGRTGIVIVAASGESSVR